VGEAELDLHAEALALGLRVSEEVAHGVGVPLWD